MNDGNRSNGSWRWCLPAIGLLIAALALPTWGQTPGGAEQLPPRYSEESFMAGNVKIKVGQYLPGKGKGPFPGIVLLHGIDGLDQLPTNLQVQLLYGAVASTMARQDIVVHFVHYFHRTPIKKDEIPKVKADLQKQLIEDGRKLDPKLVDYYQTWLDTAKDSVEFLRSRKEVDKAHVGVVGLSLGGFLGTSLAVKYPELKLSVVGNLFGGLAPGHADLVRKGKMKLPPMLIMSGEEDDVVPPRFQRELFMLLCETGNKCEAHFYGDYGHGFYDQRTKNYDQNMALKEALPTALRYLKRHLQGK